MNFFEKSNVVSASYSTYAMECSPCDCGFGQYCDSYQWMAGPVGLENSVEQANIRFGSNISPTSI